MPPAFDNPPHPIDASIAATNPEAVLTPAQPRPPVVLREALAVALRLTLRDAGITLAGLHDRLAATVCELLRLPADEPLTGALVHLDGEPEEIARLLPHLSAVLSGEAAVVSREQVEAFLAIREGLATGRLRLERGDAPA